MNTSPLRLSLLGTALLLGSAASGQSSPSTSGSRASAARSGDTVTWYRDVLPIVRERCQTCHEPEGVGAFPMLTHDQAMEHLSEIGEAVRSGYMPPWQPADGCQTFRDARRLTKREANTLLAWVAQGGPAGEVTAVPPTPSKQAGLVPADLTLTAEPVEPVGEDSTRCYAFSWGSAQARDVVAYEVQPGGASVQHVVLFSAPDIDVNALDAQDEAPGWACSGDPGTLNARVVAVWAPGQDVTHLPPGTGIRVPAGAPFIMQVHTAASTGEAPDPTVVKLQFSRQPVQRVATFLPVWKSGYSIPSRATGFTLNRVLRVPEDGSLLGVFPHMHELGRRIKLEAGNACVIDIPYWDATSQQPYFFESLVGVPLRKSSRIKLTCTWNNPSTRRVRSGEGPGRETCMAWLYLTR